MKFTDFPLHPEILKGLDQAGFTECTRVQELTIQEVILAGQDVTVQSQTGTGKTGAFLIPIFQILLTKDEFKGRKALILAPTRELAVQIEEEAKVLGAFTGLKYGSVYGGVGYGQQEDMLRSGVDILIATPGRLMDFMDSRKINLHDFSIVVIDEADRLLDMGFYPDVKKILSRCVTRDQRKTLLFSATMSTRVSNIAWEHMNEPVNIEIQAENLTVDLIDQKLFHLSSDEKMTFLLGYLRSKNPNTVLVFTNTKRKAEELSIRLGMNGFPACFLMGDLAQKRRLAVINDMKQGKIKLLVATDVAARGLHIDALDLVVNYDLPEDPENYVHRIGRTARAGASGTAISLSCERFVYALPAIEKYLNMKIPLGEFGPDSFSEDASRGKRIVLSTQDEDDRSFRSRTSGGGGRGPGQDRGARRPSSRPGNSSAGSREFLDKKPEAAAPDNRPSPRPGNPAHQNNSHKSQSGHGRPGPEHRKPAADSRAPLPLPKTVEERLDYYRQKYGESFVPTPELLERLRRDEERAHEQRNRAMAGQKPSNGGGNKHGGRKPQQAGETRKPRDQAVPVKAPVKTSVPEPSKANEEKKPVGGVVGWIKGLFQRKK